MSTVSSAALRPTFDQAVLPGLRLDCCHGIRIGIEREPLLSCCVPLLPRLLRENDADVCGVVRHGSTAPYYLKASASAVDKANDPLQSARSISGIRVGSGHLPAPS